MTIAVMPAPTSAAAISGPAMRNTAGHPRELWLHSKHGPLGFPRPWQVPHTYASSMVSPSKGQSTKRLKPLNVAPVTAHQTHVPISPGGAQGDEQIEHVREEVNVEVGGVPVRPLAGDDDD